MGRKITPPEPISPDHVLSQFSCGNESLDLWLSRRALKNEIRQSSRTFVIREGNRVIAYYALAAGSVALDAAISKARRNMPNPIPVVVLGRLAIDQDYQGRGLGKALLRDVILRTLQAADILGIKAMLVHALDEKASKFYRDCGFSESPIDNLTLMLLLSEVDLILNEE